MSEMEWMRIFKDNLRDILKEIGMTPKEFAEESGLTVQSIYRYLNGERMPTLTAILKMYYVLSGYPINLTLEDFIFFGDTIN